ncbi:MAG: lysylphosphatidylglycerol synthase transmembrane domain-containing protein [Thermoanaerobaculia bacterium]
MKRTVRLAAVILAMVVLLALFFRNSDPVEVMRLIVSIDPLWIAIAFAANLIALFARSERWRTLLNPERPPAYYPTFLSVTVGYMSSSLLPVRAGDVVRAALMKQKTGARFSSSIATVLTERVLDLVAILGMLCWFVVAATTDAAFTSEQRLLLRSVGIVSGAILAAMLFFVVGILVATAAIRRFHERLGNLMPHRFRDPWMHFFDTFTSSFRIAAEHPRAFVKVIALTIVTWACLASQFWFTARALAHDLPYLSSFLMTGVTIVGLMIPTPGGVGGFHKACQVALMQFYAFGIDDSVALAVVFHIVGTAPVVVIGLTLFAREGLTWRLLSKIGETREE